MNFKYINHENKKYLQFIRKKPSIVSGQTECVAHHVLPHHSNDLYTVPLTWSEHSEIHFIGHESFEKKYNINIDQEVMRLMGEFISNFC